MSNWFTVETIDDYTYAISEYKHWEQVHSYLLIGKTKAILIDTGLGIANIKEVVDSLTSLPVFVVTTHVHWDHIGGHQYFKDIAVHKDDADWLSKIPLPLHQVHKDMTKEACEFPESFRIEDYKPYQGGASKLLEDGEVIVFDNRELVVVHTPGHSPGHICLFEKATGYLFSGDLLYKGYLDMFYPSTNPIDFYASVKKLKTFPVKKIYPAHYEIGLDAQFIEEVVKEFQKLEAENKLYQGSGIYTFNDFGFHM